MARFLRANGRQPTLYSTDSCVKLAVVTIQTLEETLKSVGYDRQKAAEILGIGLRTLYRKMKEYGIWSG